MRSPSLAANIARLSSGQFFRQATGVFTAILKPRFLSPEQFGLWNLFTLVADYTTYADMGVMESMRYIVPLEEGRGDSRRAAAVRSTIFWGTFSARVIVVAALIGMAFLSPYPLLVRMGCAVIGVEILLRWYQQYASYLMLAYHQIAWVSNSVYLRSLLNVTIGLLLLWKFALPGQYLATLLCSLAVLAYLLLRRTWTVSATFDSRLYGEVLRKGFSIMGINLSIFLLKSVDRLIVASFLGVTALGYYALVGMIFDFLIEIPTAARAVMEPNLMKELATGEQDALLRKYYAQPLVNTAYYLPFLMAFSHFAIPVAVELAIPRYASSVLPAQTVLFCAFFMALIYPLRGILIAFRWERGGVAVMMAGLGLQCALSVALVSRGYGLVSLTACKALAMGVVFLGISALIGRRSAAAARLVGATVRQTMVPFLVTVACLSLSRIVTLAPNRYLDGGAKFLLVSLVLAGVLAAAIARNPLVRWPFACGGWRRRGDSGRETA